MPFTFSHNLTAKSRNVLCVLYYRSEPASDSMRGGERSLYSYDRYIVSYQLCTYIDPRCTSRIASHAHQLSVATSRPHHTAVLYACYPCYPCSPWGLAGSVGILARFKIGGVPYVSLSKLTRSRVGYTRFSFVWTESSASALWTDANILPSCVGSLFASVAGIVEKLLCLFVQVGSGDIDLTLHRLQLRAERYRLAI